MNLPYDKMHESSKRVYSIDGLSPIVNTVGGGNLEPKILEDFYPNREIRVYDNCPTLRADRPGLKVLETSGYYVGMSENFQTQPLLNLARTVKFNDNAVIEKMVLGKRVRRLTPKECWRLMGFRDKDYKKAKASGMSNSQLYKQAGNSIVVNVLEQIFKEMI